MHDRFSLWLARVNVQLVDKVARSRWGAVKALVSWATTPQSLLRISSVALTGASVPEAQRQEISKVLQGGDASLPMVGNDAELQVLAASAALQLLADEGSAGDIVALCMATGTFGDREPEVTPGLAELALNYLSQRAVTARAYSGAPSVSGISSGQASAVSRHLNAVSRALPQDEEDDHAGDQPASTIVVKNLNRAVQLLTEYVKDAGTSESSAYNELIRTQSVLSEEIDILWWIINGQSRELGKARGQASVAALTLPSAHELADLATGGVPPAASLEYLRHALSSAQGEAPQELTVMDAMEGPGRAWRASVIADLPGEGTEHIFPITAGLRIMGEVLGRDDRNRLLRERTGLAGSFAAAPDEVALQVLRELSLITCLSTPRP